MISNQLAQVVQDPEAQGQFVQSRSRRVDSYATRSHRLAKEGKYEKAKR